MNNIIKKSIKISTKNRANIKITKSRCTKYKNQLQQPNTIRSLEILTMGCNRIYADNNISYDDFLRLRVYGKNLFPEYKLLRTHVRTYEINMDQVKVLYNDIEINRENIREQFNR